MQKDFTQEIYILRLCPTVVSILSFTLCFNSHDSVQWCHCPNINRSFRKLAISFWILRSQRKCGWYKFVCNITFSPPLHKLQLYLLWQYLSYVYLPPLEHHWLTKVSENEMKEFFSSFRQKIFCAYFFITVWKGCIVVMKK